jgi:hypothetical protein
MDKLAQYRQYVQTLITRYAGDHYQWMNVGWQHLNRIYRTIIHIDIKDGKIWLQQNLTDQDPAKELVEMGVPREDIVLGLQAPYKRPYTDYGVA